MQLGSALPGLQLSTAPQGHRCCRKPAAAPGIHSKRNVPAAAAAWRASSSTSNSGARPQPAAASVPSCAPALQRRRQQLRTARRVAAGSSSLPLPEPSRAPSRGNSQQLGAAPITGDAGSTMDPQVVATWLQQYLPFKLLSDSSVALLAELMEVEHVPAGKLLAREGSTPERVVVLRQGSITVTGGNLPVPLDAGPGASCFLIELLLGQPSASSVRTSSDCVLWVVRRPELLGLAARRPDLVLELGLKMSQDLAAQVEAMEANQQSEERRSRALQPYRVTTPSRGIIGNSKYADRLRRQIVAAARDPQRKPVLVFGEPGLCKDNVATLLHFGGPDKLRVMVALDVTQMDPFMTELFGRGNREGLLHWIRDGTLAIYNVHKAAPYVIPQLRRLLAEGVYQPAPAPVPLGSIDFPQAERRSSARIIMTAAQRIPAFDGLTTVIQVPPLRVRPADIIDLERYLMRVLSKQKGVRLALTPEAERTLLGYSFPNNIVELEGMVQRAAAQTDPAEVVQGGAGRGADAGSPYTGVSRSLSGSLALDKDVFWFAAQNKDRFRCDWRGVAAGGKGGGSTCLPVLRPRMEIYWQRTGASFGAHRRWSCTATRM
eukprot:GHRQ01011715.1.p1 GENE.GHRQ01011715.1~~GHRQ01011715.1.p1  ORF type:complete len:603 (+),score=315.83 GHRQ01011715.1:299-2107(+)